MGVASAPDALAGARDALVMAGWQVTGPGKKKKDVKNKERNWNVALPAGQKCASGTCAFKHKDDAVCWRDASKEVTIHADVYNDVLKYKAIMADRIADGKKRGITPLPLRARGTPEEERTRAAGQRPAAAVTAAGALSQSSLVDLVFGNSVPGMMLSPVDEAEPYGSLFDDDMLSPLCSPIGADLDDDDVMPELIPSTPELVPSPGIDLMSLMALSPGGWLTLELDAFHWPMQMHRRKSRVV